MASPSQAHPLVELVASHQYLDSYQTHPSNILVQTLSAVSKQQKSRNYQHCNLLNKGKI